MDDMAKTRRRKLVAIVLAAGQGSRMHSQIPKVLHSICGTPMIDHVLGALAPLAADQVYVVTGHQHDEVKAHIGTRAVCVLQRERLGTGHAVKMVMPKLRGFDGDVLIMVGDAPLIKAETLEGLVQRRRSHHTACAVLTTRLKDPHGYGRIVRNRDGTVRKIVEQKDTNTYEEAIDEINTGTYCFDAKHLAYALSKVTNKNAQKEYYLTDTVEILRDAGHEVEASVCDDPTEVIGVNRRADMALAERYLRMRILEGIMDSGVTVIDPSTTYIDSDVRLGIDTKIHPFTILQGSTVVGEQCEIGPNVTVRNARLGKGVRVRNSVIEDSSVDDGVVVGPYALVRRKALLREGAYAGTFVEIAGSDIGRNTEVRHLSYVGDAHVGDDSYLGAGAMTINFDGKTVHRTEIGDGVFVGSNALLMAPLRIGDHQRVPPNTVMDASAGLDEPAPPPPPAKAARKASKKAAAKKPVKPRKRAPRA